MQDLKKQTFVHNIVFRTPIGAVLPMWSSLISSDFVLGAGLVTAISDMTPKSISNCSLPESCCNIENAVGMQCIYAVMP